MHHFTMEISTDKMGGAPIKIVKENTVQNCSLKQCYRICICARSI